MTQTKLLQNNKTISIVVPCFNEEESIPTVIPRILHNLDQLKKTQRIDDYELIVVNDQSTDQSQALLKEYKRINICNTMGGGNRGYGKALKTGFNQTSGQWIGFLDMDNSYRPEDIYLFIDEIDREQSDFIMGIRSFNDKGMSPLRGFGNWLYVVLANFFYNSPINDVCSGFRLFHRKHLNNILEIPEEGLNFSIYMTLKMLIKQVPIKQIPIHYDMRLGTSKLSVIRDGFAFLKVLLILKKKANHVVKHRSVS